MPEGVVAGEVSANVSTTDANGFASDTDAFAVLPASNISGWTVYVDGFRNLSTGAINNVYPVYAPNLNGKDASGNKVQAWLDGRVGAESFATGSFFADVRAMATYGGGISVDAPPQQFFHNIPAGTDGNGQAEYQALTEGEIAWANANNLHSIWIISPNTSGANYNAISQQLVRTLETNATGSQANIPSEYVVENYGTTTKIETNNAIGSETDPNTELGVGLWLAGYEQGRSADLQLTPTATGSTNLKITQQSATSLAGKNTTVAVSTSGLQASTYSVTLTNTSSNTSNWYIPTLTGVQNGDSADWSVHVTLNGLDITSQLLSSSGFTFNATASLATAGIVMDPGDTQTLMFTFDPLNANADADPYSFTLTGRAHPGAADSFASATFISQVPEPAVVSVFGLLGVLGLARRSCEVRRRAPLARPRLTNSGVGDYFCNAGGGVGVR